MRKIGLLLAAMSGCVASSAFGGFTVTHMRTSVDSVLDRIDLYALNTGGGTGTGLLAVELSISATQGVAVFRSTSAGNWNPLNSADTLNRSQVRIDPDDVSSSSLVAKTPSANQPLAPQYGASTVALGNFTVVVASLAGAIPPQSAAGNLFASLFVTKNYLATLSGNVGGSAGAKEPFPFMLVGGHGDGDPVPPVILPQPPIRIDFGADVTSGVQFTATVTATDVNQSDRLSLFVAPVVGISNVSYSPSSSISPAVFTVTGTVDYALNGTTVLIPISVSDGAFHVTNGSLTLIVTPEPVSLCVLIPFALPRRRGA